MNIKKSSILFSSFVVLSLFSNKMFGWGTKTSFNYASQKSDYKSKKNERNIALVYFSQNKEALKTVEKCYNDLENTPQCDMFRRFMKIAQIRLLSEKKQLTSDEIVKACDETPNDKRELHLIVTGQLKNQEQEITDQETEQHLEKFYEAGYGKKPTKEEKQLLIEKFNQKLINGNLAARCKVLKNEPTIAVNLENENINSDIEKKVVQSSEES